MTSVAVLGVGAVGARVARQLLSTGERRRRGAARRAARPGSRRSPARWARAPASTPARYADPLDVDVVVLAGPPGTHLEPARRFVAAGVAGGVGVRRDRRGAGPARPRRRGRERGRDGGGRRRLRSRADLRAGRHAAGRFDAVDEIHVAKVGTGGPACARQHHRALRGHGPRLARRRLGPAPGRHRAASCAGSPIRSAPRTATGPRCPTPCCWCRPSPASAGSPPAWPPPGATASPPGCPCCGRPTPRAARRGAGRGPGPAGHQPRRPRARRHGPPGGGRRRGGRARRAWAAQGRLARAGAAGLAELVDPVPVPARAAPARACAPRCSSRTPDPRRSDAPATLSGVHLGRMTWFLHGA